MKKILSIVMTLILLWGLAMPAAAAETAVGSTLRLEKTEGTVTVKNASGKSLTLKNGMRLYSGSKIKTDKESYAYISLDSGKAVKLGASSEGEVRKSGKKLELKVLSGELFFDISVPLEQDESLNIRTSTMVTGVRGTVGYVVVRDRYHSEVCLLEGRLTVTGTDEVSGGIRTTEITAGQKATTVMQQTTQGEQVKLTVETLKEAEVPGFVAVAVAQDTTLQKRIEQKSTLDVKKIIEDAQKRLEAEQEAAAKVAEEVQRQVEEQSKETRQDQPEQVFTPSSEPSGSGGGSSYVPPAEVQLSGSTTQADLAAAFASGTPKVTVPAGATLSINEGTTAIPAGKTLELEGTVNIEQGAVLDNSGSININSSESVHVRGSLNNSGTINIGAGEKPGLLTVEQGTMSNSGTITVNLGSFVNYGEFTMTNGTVASANGAAFTNYGTATISGGTVSGCGSAIDSDDGGLTVNGNAEIKAAKAAMGESENACVINGDFTWGGGKLMVQDISYFPQDIAMPEITEANGWFTADFASPVRNLPAEATINHLLEALAIENVTVNLSGDLTIDEGKTVSIQNNQTLNIKSGTLTVASEGTLTVPGGTVNIDKTAVISNQGGTINVSSGGINASGSAIYNFESGIINVSGGTVHANNTVNADGPVSGSGIAISNTASTVNVTGGTVSAAGTAISSVSGTVTVSGGTVSADDTAISNGENTTISGGLVSGGTCAIANSGSLTLKGDATVEVKADPEGNASVISSTGSFGWQGGKLKAKSKSYFPLEAELAEITSDGVWFIADYMATTRNLTADRIANLNAILALNHVTAVTLDLGGSSDPVELGQALIVPTGKTLNLQNGTLSVGEKSSIVVNGSLAYDNIVNYGNVYVNSGGSVVGTGDFTNNGTVINNHSFTSGTNFTNYAELTINSDNQSGVQFINGGTFINKRTVLNNGKFDSSGDKKIIYNGQSSGSAATFTNNSGAELVNGGTFYNYAALNNTSGSNFTNSGIFNNYNAGFMPTSTFWNLNPKGYWESYQNESLRTGSYVMVTANSGDNLGQVQSFEPIAAWNQRGAWTNGTTVTMYGQSSTLGTDASDFLTVAAGKTVTLDLNGRTVNLDSNSLTVSGNLTIKDSSATNTEGTNGTGVLTSSNTTATVIVKDTGKCILISGTIQNTSSSGAAVKSQIDTNNDNATENMTSRGFDHNGGILRAMIEQVWDEIGSSINQVVKTVENIFELIFGTHNG